MLIKMILFFVILGAFSAIMTLFYILQEATQKQERFFTLETVRKLFRMLGVFRFKTVKDCFAEEGRTTKEMYRFRFWHPITIIFVLTCFPINVLMLLVTEVIPETIKDVMSLRYWNDWYD